MSFDNTSGYFNIDIPISTNTTNGTTNDCTGELTVNGELVVTGNQLKDATGKIAEQR
eukprot:m.116005 g.116005  ORF g.116005 m.116005 type:complete len:57 (+) comp12847_c0_seq1:278-448(+)